MKAAAHHAAAAPPLVEVRLAGPGRAEERRWQTADGYGIEVWRGGSGRLVSKVSPPAGPPSYRHCDTMAEALRDAAEDVAQRRAGEGDCADLQEGRR